MTNELDDSVQAFENNKNSKNVGYFKGNDCITKFV